MAKTYDSYKDSGIAWIGEIPEGWEVLALKRIFKIIAGATPKSENEAYWDGDIAWITPADYKTEQKYVSFGRRNLSEQGYHACSTVLLPKGSIVFSKRAPIGLVAITERELCTNQGCLGCVPIRDVSNVFMYYLLSVYTEQFELYGSGTTFKEISANNFANFKLMLPPLSEQQSIASFLDTKCGEIDSLISLQEEMISELQAYKQSVITEAVTKGLDPNAKMNCCASREKNDACISSSETQPAIERKFKDSGVEWIGEIPEGWSMVKMQYLANLQSGHNLTNEQITDEGLYPVFGGNGIRGFYHEYSLDGDYVLIGRQGALCGNINYAHGKFWPTEHAVVCHPKVKYNYIWFGEMLRAMNLGQYSLSAAQPGLSVERIKQLQLPVPPLSEQQSIATYLDAKTSQIDSLISLKQQKIDELKSYKKSIIYEYVTGKKRV